MCASETIAESIMCNPGEMLDVPGLFLGVHGCACVCVCASMLYYPGDWGRELSRWEFSGGLQGPGVLEKPMTGSAEGVE